MSVRAGRHGEGAEESLAGLLRTAIERGASDIHLAPGYPATLRVHGELEPLDDTPLTPDAIERLVDTLVPDALKTRLMACKDADCSISFEHEGVAHRFRASLFASQEHRCACLRHIPAEIPSLDWLGFPASLADRLIGYPNGLVVITGITGSGKSATLAALIDRMRRQSNRRVLTIEEPIEYIHAPGAGGLVTQREVGRDVESFAAGLRHGLRQDPDVMLVGEIRDRETAQIALSAAETGHLILATLHTRDAKGAVSRLVDLFPLDAQEDVRKQLAMSLRSVVCQHLLPSAEPGARRTLALEVLHVTQAVEIAIRTGRIETLESALQTGKRDGQIALDDNLQQLVAAQRISVETARRHARNPDGIRGGGTAW